MTERGIFGMYQCHDEWKHKQKSMVELLKEQIFPSSKKTWILAASLISLGNAFQLMEALRTRDNY